MKQGVKHTLQSGKFLMPAEEKQQRPGTLDSESINKNGSDQEFHIYRRSMMIPFLYDNFILYGNLLTRHQQDKGRKSHDAQPPQLKKYQNYCLSKRCKRGSRVLYGQSRDTYCRAGSEQSIHQRQVVGAGTEGQQ